MGDVFGKDQAKSPAADAQARIAQQLFTQTDPLRRGLIDRSTNFVGAPAAIPAGGGAGGKDGALQAFGQGGGAGPVAASPDSFVTGSPTYLAYKDVADRNFNKAKDNAIARTAPGGALTDALVGLEGQRAGDLTQAAGNIYENELGRAMTLATGTTSQSLGAFGQAGMSQAELAKANAQQNGDKAGALGTGLGAFLALK